MIKAIIFDFHGVVFGIGTWATYTLAGGDPCADAEYIDSVLDDLDGGKITTGEYDRRISKKLGIDLALWKELNEKNEVPKVEVLSYIEQELMPKYKIGLISNANAGKVKNNLSKQQFEMFDCVIVSAEVGMLKPDPEIFRYGAKTLGVKPEECIFIDDHEPFLSGAKEIGMKTILYKDFESFKTQIESMIND